MEKKTVTPNLARSVVVFAAMLIIILAMRAAAEILSPILLALVLAITATPLLNWFIKRRAPTWLALIMTIVITILGILGIVWLVGISIQGFGDSLPQYEQRLIEIEESIWNTLADMGVDVDGLAADLIIAPEEWLDFAVNLGSGFISSLSNWALILMTTVFFLVEATIFPRKIQSMARDGNPEMRRSLQLNQDLRRYMVINAGVGLLAAAVNVLLLAIMGIEFALLWGVLSFFMSFIPNVGFLISVIPPALMALIQFGATEMIVVIVAYIVINFIVDNVIKPQFIQSGVNISATVTFISLILWTWVLGPIGAILAVPMAIILQAILASMDETRWLAYLMGSGSKPFRQEAEPEELVLE